MIIQAGYVGGSADDVAYRVAVDAAGAQYVTGATTSTDADFPVTVGPDLTYNGGPRDIFVAKVSADGSQLVYAGYIGGDGKQEAGLDIAVDAAGNAYVVGATSSTEATFPVVGGPDLTYNGGSQDGFIAEVSADGTRLLFCGYIGGAKVDEALRVSVDATGDAFVTGYTASDERTFPVHGGPDLTQNGGIDAYVAEVAPNGAGLMFAGFLGGVGKDIAFGLGRDTAGNIYVAGMTASTEATFPATVGPDVTYDGGATDAFVAKVSPDGGSILYAGYIGGSGNEKAKNLAVDAAGDAYVVGYTDSTDATFPVAVGPDLTYNGGTKDVFVAEVDPTGSSLRYAGYIGGASSDEARSVAIDGAGSAFVTGYTSSPPSSFPVIGGPSLTYRGHTDAFVCVVEPGGTFLSSCGYVGGSGQDQGLGIALGSPGDVYVVGQTGSTEASFPVAVGPDLTYDGGTHDAFVARISYASR